MTIVRIDASVKRAETALQAYTRARGKGEMP